MKNFSFLKDFKDLYLKYSQGISKEGRQKIIGYFHITLTLFTVSFFGFFAITPTLSTISNLQKQYEDNKVIYDALNKKLSNLQLLDFQYKEIQPDLEIIYSAIPRTSQIPYLTRQVENIAGNSNVLLTKLNFSTVEIYPNVKKESIYSFTFSLTAEGAQEQVNNFIASIINFDRIIGIERITTGINEESKYVTSITGRAFFSNK